MKWGEVGWVGVTDSDGVRQSVHPLLSIQPKT